ncbi:TolC family protein [Tunturiibacter empetritectus]|uniref:Outer membrane protein TolC n=1 Tax=Tunturiibacter lichenicola TaxID=2051959 RepID=A0A852VES7_9BACT|nr:TolC family protein [Edaphobacter lichenicola]NYF88745.1 outer membrane protein TolC [Edaphobacter lichenicola]
MKSPKFITLLHPIFAAIALVSFTAVIAQAQGGSSSGAQSSKAQQVQLSGRSQGGASVSVQQSGSSSTSSSVNTINSTVQVQGNYAGSVNAPMDGTGPVDLTFAQAIQLGLHYNLGGIASDASSRQLRAQRLSALSNLLPNIYATLAESAAKTDLQTSGISSSTFSSGSAGGLSIPSVVGPYHYYSLEGNLSEQLSLTDLHNLRSANAAHAAAVLNMRDARELVIVAVGGSYLRILASIALVESQEIQVQYAQASYQQTAAQLQSGTKAEIDANKSLVELQTEQQRLSSQKGDLIKQKMQLARIIGINPGRDIHLAEKLSTDIPVSDGADASIGYALKHRVDLQAAGQQLQAAEEAYRASKSEYLPSFAVSGYYGLQGTNPNKGAGVFSASATLTVPIFNSGKTKSDVQQADAAVMQRKAEATDQRGAVEDDVRSALVDLQVASHQVQVAQSNRTLAKSTLQQSLDRYAAGVTNSVEVVQSQETLASAEHDYISSLYSLNLSKISLARAMGNAEETIPDMLKGN